MAMPHALRRPRALRLGPWLLLLCLTAAHGAHAPDRSAERALYRDALADLYAVRLRAFEAKVERLEDYPLLPYLHYNRLLRYVSSSEPEEFVAFRERFADTPLANSLLTHWLDNLARRGHWQLYREHFDPAVATTPGLQCRYYRALYETGEREAALAGAARMWVADESRPTVCDPLFDAWRRAGGLTDDLAWERLALVLAANRPTLGGYLLRYLQPEGERLGREFVALHRQPGRIEQLRQLPGDSERVATVVEHSIRRLARQNPEAAERAWEQWSARIELDSDRRQRLQAEILRWQIRRNALPEDFSQRWSDNHVDQDGRDGLLEELARRAIGQQHWPEVLLWISRLSEAERQRVGWRYWRARASLILDAAGQDPLPAGALPPDQARALLADVADERNYYGFMAAEQLGLPANMRAESLDLSPTEIDAVARHPAVQRALELYAMGESPDARRELGWLRRQLDDRELLALAEVSRRHGWHGQAIQATIAARSWNQMELRFPLAFAEPILANARLRELEPSWVFAVARQESAFMTDARSHAGALGVMQVLPATARRTARQLDIPLANTWQLLDYGKNIEIGSGYLAQMYQRYDRNRILASAAYNAGPGRVDQWLAQRPASPADVWIESIPFRETRGYVQNVLAFALIYSLRLDQEQPFLYDHER